MTVVTGHSRSDNLAAFLSDQKQIWLDREFLGDCNFSPVPWRIIGKDIFPKSAHSLEMRGAIRTNRDHRTT